MARFISLLACIMLPSFSFGTTQIASKGTVTYKPTNMQLAENHTACKGSDKFTSQFTIEWLHYPDTAWADIDGLNARITYQLKLPDQTYNIADIELHDLRVIHRRRNSMDGWNYSTFKFKFKVFARDTADGLFTQEVGTATAFFSFYKFGLSVKFTNKDGQIVNFSFSGAGDWPPTGQARGYWKGSLLGGFMEDNCRMTWNDKVVSVKSKEE